MPTNNSEGRSLTLPYPASRKRAGFVVFEAAGARLARRTPQGRDSRQDRPFALESGGSPGYDSGLKFDKWEISKSEGETDGKVLDTTSWVVLTDCMLCGKIGVSTRTGLVPHYTYVRCWKWSQGRHDL